MQDIVNHDAEQQINWDDFFSESKTERKFALPSGKTNVSNDVILHQFTKSKEYEKRSKTIYEWLKNRQFLLRRFDMYRIGFASHEKESNLRLIEDILIEEEIDDYPGELEDIYMCWMENRNKFARMLYGNFGGKTKRREERK